ncbi:MAG: thioesterase family protein [Dehalococcoidia bacterium]|nr:thioesterase family protein [Dehalococcoidia bacterium]
MAILKWVDRHKLWRRLNSDDMFHHVNNARYLELLEEGRWVFFEQNRSSDEWPQGIAIVVVNININHRRPATFGDILEVRTDISDLGAKRSVIHQEIILQGAESIVDDADVTFVIVDSKTQQTLPLENGLASGSTFEKQGFSDINSGDV